MRLDQRRRELTVTDGHRKWPHQFVVEEVLENRVGFHEETVERLRESGELGHTADRRKTDDVESEGAEESRGIELRSRLVPAP